MTQTKKLEFVWFKIKSLYGLHFPRDSSGIFPDQAGIDIVALLRDPAAGLAAAGIVLAKDGWRCPKIGMLFKITMFNRKTIGKP